jgi:WD40 repeat protein
MQFLTDNTLITGSDDGTLYVWNTNIRSLIHNSKGHNTRIKDITVLDTSSFISISSDGLIKMWKINLSPVCKVELASQVNANGRLTSVTAVLATNQIVEEDGE